MSTAAPLSSGKDEEFEKKDEMDGIPCLLGEEDKSKPFVAPRWSHSMLLPIACVNAQICVRMQTRLCADLALARSKL